MCAGECADAVCATALFVPRWLPAPHGKGGFLRHRLGIRRGAWMTITQITEFSRRRDRDVQEKRVGGGSRRGFRAQLQLVCRD